MKTEWTGKNSKRRCVIFFASPQFDAEASLAAIQEGDLIIACDGGYEHAKRIGIKPDLIVGDFDSYTGQLPCDIPQYRAPVEKDDTDGMLAVKLAMERGCDSFLLLGATGGRMDHMLGNLFCMAYIAGLGCTCAMEDASMRLMTVCGGETLRLTGYKGYTVSVLPHTEKASGITLRGMKYPLQNGTMTNDFPLGISNVVSEDTAEIHCETGLLFVFLMKSI